MRALLLLPLLFACKDDEPIDSGGPPDAAGLAGAIGSIERTSLMGSYWAEGATGYAVAWWGLIEPMEFSFWDFFGGAPDGCTNRLGFPRVNLYDVGTGATTLIADDVALTLPLAEDGYFAADLSEADFVPEARYDLSPLIGGGLDGLAITGLAYTPGDFSLLSPALGGEAVIGLSPAELSFTWASAGADYVLILIERRDPEDPTRVVEAVGCVVEDDGAFQVPEGAWDGAWASGQWLYISIGPARQGDGIVPLNGSDSRMVGVSWHLGAARAR